MNTYERASFVLDELGQWDGIHDPTERWNGFACPLFTLDTCRAIAEVINALDNEEVIEITDGKLFSIYLGNGPREVEEILPVIVDDVAMYPLGAGGWVWDTAEAIDGNPHPSSDEYTEPCEECGADMTSTGDGWTHALTADSHKCYTAYRWGVK